MRSVPASAHRMRSDRHGLCLTCRHRVHASGPCRVCGAEDPIDLRRPGAEGRALEALRRPVGPRGWLVRGAPTTGNRPPRTRGASLYMPRTARVVALLIPAALLVAATEHPSALAALVALFVVPTLAAAGYFVAYGAAAVVRDARRILLGPEPDPVAGLPSLAIADERLPVAGLSDRARVEGRVRVRRPLTSPVRHLRAAAIRVVGVGPLGPVDDAAGVDFDLETSTGPVRVAWGSALVDLEVGGPPRALRPDRRLTWFLRERAIFPDLGAVRLAEEALVDGDVAVVEGDLAEDPIALGYREQKRVPTLRGRPEAPLVVRRAPDPAPPPGAVSEEGSGR